MADINIPVSLAPNVLNQPILPGWQFSLFSVNLGESTNPEIEKAAIKTVGSYGKQIGHLAEALEVVINHFGLLQKDLPQKQHDALQIFMGNVSKVRKLKAEHPISMRASKSQS